MFATPSHLPEKSRQRIVDELNGTLADGIDLFTQTKVAHWNVKGALFAQLHEQFEKLAGTLAELNDDIAERAVTLGGRAVGTARAVAASSRIAEYPRDVTRDLEHVRLLAERVDKWLEGARHARGVAVEEKDDDTADLMTGGVRDVEKYGWFLRATLEG